MVEKELAIEWKETGEGWEESKFKNCGRSRVLRPENGIKEFMHYILLWLACEPAEKRSTLKPMCINPLGAIRPRISTDTIQEITVRVYYYIAKWYDCTDKVPTQSGTDGKFLVILGNTRNWKAAGSCPACVADGAAHPGQLCGCGLSETVVSRPCGHVVCGPCFVTDFVKAHGIENQRKPYLSDVICAKNKETPFKCPTCSAPVDHVFQAEEIDTSTLISSANRDWLISECVSLCK